MVAKAEWIACTRKWTLTVHQSLRATEPCLLMVRSLEVSGATYLMVSKALPGFGQPPLHQAVTWAFLCISLEKALFQSQIMD